MERAEENYSGDSDILAASIFVGHGIRFEPDDLGRLIPAA
jgi:hypothetical protein